MILPYFIRELYVKTFILHFDGSWSDSIREELPEYSGDYLVYRGNLDHGNFLCREILYISHAVNICSRHKKHEKRDLLVCVLYECYSERHDSLELLVYLCIMWFYSVAAINLFVQYQMYVKVYWFIMIVFLSWFKRSSIPFNA